MLLTFYRYFDAIKSHPTSPAPVPELLPGLVGYIPSRQNRTTRVVSAISNSASSLEGKIEENLGVDCRCGCCFVVVSNLMACLFEIDRHKAPLVAVFSNSDFGHKLATGTPEGPDEPRDNKNKFRNTANVVTRPSLTGEIYRRIIRLAELMACRCCRRRRRRSAVRIEMSLKSLYFVALTAAR